MSHTFTVKGSRRYRYYACSSAQKNGRATCPCPSVPAAEIEQFVVEEIRAIGREPALVAETLRQARKQVEADEERLQKEQRVLQRELRRHYGELQAVAKQGDGVAPRLADLHERIRAAEERLAATGRELGALAGQRLDDGLAVAALAEFEPVWAALTPREQERLLRLLIQRIEFDGEQVSITFQPAGIQALAANVDQRRTA
jgi:site-specific DNA recombinase